MNRYANSAATFMRFLIPSTHEVSGSDLHRVSTLCCATSLGFLNLLTFYSSWNRPTIFQIGGIPGISPFRGLCLYWSRHRLSVCPPFMMLSLCKRTIDSLTPQLQVALQMLCPYLLLQIVSYWKHPRIFSQSNSLQYELNFKGLSNNRIRASI
jgi:hypothetical protein